MTTTTQPKINKIDSVFECPRCAGKGYIDAFRHVQNGLCFLCVGNKTINVKQIRIFKDKLNVFYFKHIYSDHSKDVLEIRQNDNRGCTVWSHSYNINTENRQLLRELWSELKSNGHEMSAIEMKHGLILGNQINIPKIGIINQPIEKVTEKAIYIEGIWIPKSVLTDTGYSECYAVPKWFADKYQPAEWEEDEDE